MQYTFPKGPRMGLADKKELNPIFYNLPDVRSTRAAGFGYGHKYDFTQGQAQTPAPNAYAVKGETGNVEKKGFSFGLSREQMAATGSAFVGDRQSPGPGAYDTRETNKVSLAYSFRPRVNSTDQKQAILVPGPGAYDSLNTMSPKGKMFVAKYKSSGACTISPSKAKRFDLEKEANAPCPGTYNTTGEINNTGSYFVSKFKSSVGKTFGLSLKKADSTEKFRSMVPGPGHYKVPSEFGQYESKDAQKESKDKSTAEK